ncbi:MAG TPA: sulfatase-like hydrolase/transferase [Chitinophagaceae bacterium]|nr:sulfatase-like hydrolase/transferase [Chitinophagaceae bacterium]
MESKNISRKEAIQRMGLLGLTPMLPKFLKSFPGGKSPNIILVICDQWRADACKREGFPLDTTPFLDSLAGDGTWFNKAYCAYPACVPSRTAMLTGRFPNATRVKSNFNIQDATYSKDMIDAVKARGYLTGCVGKNFHSYLKEHPERFDYWRPYYHLGERPTDDPQVKKFNKYLQSTHFYASFKPAPFSYKMQQPYRIVSDSIGWIDKVKEKDNPFFLYMSIPEPHNPYQVSEPYYSMFPPDKLPPLKTDAGDLKIKGKKFTMQKELEDMGYPGYEKHIPRIRSNYYGMLRLIDDQMKRLVDFLKDKDLYDNTVVIFVADHGDFTGEYGLIKKGVGVPECLTRIPMIWHGPGVIKNPLPHDAHVSNVDIMPTICDIVDYPLPDGVIGRSLWPLLLGQAYPKADFASMIIQQGFGGRDYTSVSQLDPYKEGALAKGKHEFDELNSYSQSGFLRGLRKDDWKLVYDMQGNGKMYHLPDDPSEVKDLYQDKAHADKKTELLADMLAWELRTQDPLPLPRRRYIYRGDKHNYWTPYHDTDVE